MSAPRSRRPIRAARAAVATTSATRSSRTHRGVRRSIALASQSSAGAQDETLSPSRRTRSTSRCCGGSASGPDDRAAAGGGRDRRPRAGERGLGPPLRAGDLTAAQELADRCGLYSRERTALPGAAAGARRARGDPRRRRRRGDGAGADGRLRYVNEAAVRLLGAPIGLGTARGAARRRAGRSSPDAFEILGEDGQPLGVERLPGRLALTGEEPEPVIDPLARRARRARSAGRA